MKKQKVFRAYLIAPALVLIGTPFAAGRSAAAAAAMQGDEFIVEDGEVLTAVLNRNLSSERGRDGERFTILPEAAKAQRSGPPSAAGSVSGRCWFRVATSSNWNAARA